MLGSQWAASKRKVFWSETRIEVGSAFAFADPLQAATTVAETAGLADAVGLLVLTLGIAGAFVGTLAAILETDLKKLFAQSSIAQLGYMAIGIGAMSATGLAAAFIHLFNHALMKGALFLAIGAIAAQVGRASMGSIQGAGRQIPLTMTAILVGGLALIGVPALR